MSTESPAKIPHDQLYKIPIDKRPPHGFLSAKIFFPLVFNFAQLGINSAQFLALPLLLIPFVGRRWFDAAIGYTKDGYGRLLILITVLFAPTSIVFTTNTPPELAGLVERDAAGEITRLNLPDRLVIMSNHQAYLDWMYMWIVSCYAGHSRGLTILLKAQLKNIPVVGWGMQFFRFIFMHRSWAADRENLTKSLTSLGKRARGHNGGSGGLVDGKTDGGNDETSSLLNSKSKKSGKRSPLWLLIFPEGTITSDEERAKSVKYAKREGIDDFTTVLHPRSTGLLFCLRTLLPQVPDLQLLDVTIGYPGPPAGAYPQEWYGLASTFFRSVPPPSVHMHLHLYSGLSEENCEIPSLHTKPLAEHSESDTQGRAGGETDKPPADTGLASPEEAKKFELWLRGVWTEKEERMKRFGETGRFEGDDDEDGEQAREVVRIRQVKWWDHIAAFGAGGMATAVLLGVVIWQIVEAVKRA